MNSPAIIKINIGGQSFHTTIDTLTLREPTSRLAAMFHGRYQELEMEEIFIDRDGTHFRHILNWLRDGVLPIMEACDYMELLQEAKYYKLDGLIGEIEATRKTDAPDLARDDIIYLARNPENLRLQGVNLSGVDLSGLCLNGANLRNANLSGANLKSVDLVKADLRGAKLIGANMELADLTKANLCNANLTRANMETAFLYQTNLEGTIMDGAKLTSMHF